MISSLSLRVVAVVLIAIAAATHSLAGQRVRVAVFDNPPLITYDARERRAGGIFVDVLQYAASQEGWELEYVPGTFAQALERVERGEVDILPATVQTRIREDVLTYTSETMVTSWGRIYVKPGQRVTSVRDLAGKKVAVIKGTVLRETLWRRTAQGGAAATLVEYDSLADAFRAVAQGRADAVFCNRFSGALHARQTGLRASPVVLEPYGFRYASPHDARHEELLDALDRNLLLLKTDPDSAYYRGVQALEDEARAFTMPLALLRGGAGALIVAMIALAWAFTARRAAAHLRRSRRELRRAHEELQRLTELSLCLMAVFDRDFRVLRVNGACERLLGTRPQRLVGANVLDWVPPECRPGARRTLEQVRTGRPVQGQASQILRADDKVVPVVWSLVWSQEAQELYAIGYDDTERHALIASHKQRSQQLSAANQHLQTFARTVAHELRAPVAAVGGFVGKVLSDNRETLDERSQHLLTRALAASDRMDAVIDNLLRLARLTESGIRPRRCDVSAMCHDVVSALRNQAPGRSVTFEIQPGMNTVADGDLLRHVFENLLGNAWKFTSREPRARIVVGCEPDPDGPVFFVRDNGAGFDNAYAQNLFRPFRRLHSEAEFSGTGIGLSIAHRVVTAHGGRIWAEGRPGRGAVFRFTLPESVDVGEAPADPAPGADKDQPPPVPRAADAPPASREGLPA